MLRMTYPRHSPALQTMAVGYSLSFTHHLSLLLNSEFALQWLQCEAGLHSLSFSPSDHHILFSCAFTHIRFFES
jgi:hypothetical protein